jgi:hypothetical protein
MGRRAIGRGGGSRQVDVGVNFLLGTPISRVALGQRPLVPYSTGQGVPPPLCRGRRGSHVLLFTQFRSPSPPSTLTPALATFIRPSTRNPRAAVAEPTPGDAQ